MIKMDCTITIGIKIVSFFFIVSYFHLLEESMINTMNFVDIIRFYVMTICTRSNK